MDSFSFALEIADINSQLLTSLFDLFQRLFLVQDRLDKSGIVHGCVKEDVLFAGKALQCDARETAIGYPLVVSQSFVRA